MSTRCAAIGLLAMIFLTACSGDGDAFDARRYQADSKGSEALAATTIRAPSTTSLDAAFCGGCHTLHQTPPFATRAEKLSEFHVGIEVNHGELPCGSCHNLEDRTTLRLASGQTLRFEDSMVLCGQCHGPQLRDYRRGSHGGMRGHWDRASGARERNHCVDCHRAHTPTFGTYDPVFAPRDRFLGDEH